MWGQRKRTGQREGHEESMDFMWKKRNSKQDKCLMSYSKIKPQTETYLALLTAWGQSDPFSQAC